MAEDNNTKQKFNYWSPKGEEKLTKSFLHHIRGTAMATDRQVDMGEVEEDRYGRIRLEDFERVLEVSNKDSAFTFDCASRHGVTHLQQIGSLMVAAPDLDTGLTLFMGCIAFLDERVIGMRLQEGMNTTYGMFYVQEVDHHFYHTQAGSLFLTAVDAWPKHYIDNSKFNFPRVPTKYTSTHGFFWSKRFPWVDVGCNGQPYLSWTVATNKTKWPAPNFNQHWFNFMIEFLKGTMDHMDSADLPWSRFVTNIMMCHPKDMTTKKSCELLQISEATLSKKLSAEGASVPAIRDWIFEEMAKRAFSEDVPEQWVCEQFGYSRGDFRARLKRRNIENPFEYTMEQKAELLKLYKTQTFGNRATDPIKKSNDFSV